MTVSEIHNSHQVPLFGADQETLTYAPDAAPAPVPAAAPVSAQGALFAVHVSYTVPAAPPAAVSPRRRFQGGERVRVTGIPRFRGCTGTVIYVASPTMRDVRLDNVLADVVRVGVKGLVSA